MRDISLLPLRYKVMREEERKKNDLVISFIFAIIILCVVYVFSFAVNLAKKTELANIKKDNEALNSTILELQKYDDMQNKVALAYGNINNLVGNSPSFSHVLMRIANSAPQMVQLTTTKLKYDPSSNTSSCVITGKAGFYDDVSKWIQTLSEIEGIGEILCTYTNQAVDANIKNVQFELQIAILDNQAVNDVVWQWES